MMLILSCLLLDPVMSLALRMLGFLYVYLMIFFDVLCCSFTMTMMFEFEFVPGLALSLRCLDLLEF